MNLALKVTQEQLADVLLHVAPVRPVFIWGAPGIGKSSLVRQFADAVGLECVSLLGSQLAPEDIAGRVTVRGRGGTVLQPGVDLLLESSDFPKKGPVLIITDGGCEPRVEVKREHAWLLPQGCALPFRDRGKVFRFQ